ncbi:hypothetical protein ACQPZA_21775 [Pseudonocardia xinjiangensis]|uniref:hypothetical protein n=1 Tax=Pseudonocardia xinjiangensis TaxID=75289 RepID=UPI003D94A176
MPSQTADSALLEKIEAECMYRLESGAPRRTLDDMGIATARCGGGSAMAMRRDVTRYWNKVLGFGFDEPVTGDLVAQVCAFFREHDAPVAVLQPASSVLPRRPGRHRPGQRPGAGKLVGEARARPREGAEGPGEHNQSLHNMRRAGFSVRYERANWVWRP